MIMQKIRTGLVLGWGMLLVAACSPENGTGTVVVTTWGEEFIEEGLPREAFPKDQYSVKYSKFLVVFHDVQIADGNHQVGARLSAPLVFDLTKQGQGKDKELASFELEAQSWPHVGYQLGPISPEAQAGELATHADVELLQSVGASVHVEGTATSPSGLEKTFNWSFSPATLFSNCHGEQAGKEVAGVLVTNGGRQEVQLTIHGDHLFYDDLQSEEGAPRFQALADADSNQDGEVTLAELDQVPLYSIPIAKGTYGTGALGNVNTLGDYQRTLARTLGHYRGEGSCDSKEVTE